MKYIINGVAYECKTEQPHGELRAMLIDAMLNEEDVEKIED